MAVLTHILAASDLSAHADRALARAVLLARRHQARLLALHVVPALSEDETFLGVRLDPALIERDAGARLRTQLASAADPGADAEIVVRIGEPFLEIIRCARERDRDLVVMGAHGERYMRELLLGTTAERVIRKGRLPVLVVKQSPQASYRRLLVPVDFSDTSRRALVLASQFAPDAELQVLHVFEIGAAYRLQSGAMVHEDLLVYERQSTLHLRRRLNEFVRAAGIDPKRAKLSVRAGYPPLAISAAARRWRADLLVSGTHGRSGLRHLLLGSVAEHALREAPCDVLAVPPEAFEFALP